MDSAQQMGAEGGSGKKMKWKRPVTPRAWQVVAEVARMLRTEQGVPVWARWFRTQHVRETVGSGAAMRRRTDGVCMGGVDETRKRGRQYGGGDILWLPAGLRVVKRALGRMDQWPEELASQGHQQVWGQGGGRCAIKAQRWEHTNEC